MQKFKLSRALLLACSMVILVSEGRSEDPITPSASAVPVVSDDICEAFADRAAEAKLARQRKQLLDVKNDIEQQLVALNEKTKQLESLVLVRNEIRKSVSEKLVKIYANVEPEIAAQQLQKLNPVIAAEVIQRLNAKHSGDIVAAMEVDFASKLVKTMMTDIDSQKKKDKSQ